jgi:WD40 repeat protein
MNVMELFNNHDGIDLPASTIGDLILPFVDRKTWNNLILSNREIYQASKKLEPPWPRGNFSTNDHHSIRQTAFSSDGKYIFGQTNGSRIHVWHKRIGPYAVLDPNAPERLDNDFRGPSMASSPTENLLVTCSSDAFVGAVLQFWDIASLSVINEVHVSGIMVIMNICGFSPDGSLVACNVFDGFDRLHIYSASDAVCIKTIATNGPPLSVSTGDGAFGGFSPDSQTLVAGLDGRVIRVWDVVGDDNDTSFQDLSPWVSETAFRPSLPFSPQGQSFVIGTADANVCKLAQYQNYIWVVKVLELSMEVDGLYFLFSPDGRLLATRHRDGNLALWDPVAGKLVQTLGECQHPPVCVTFSGDGRMLATADDHSDDFSFFLVAY